MTTTYITQGSFDGVAAVCGTCGALVLDRAAHDEFHRSGAHEPVEDTATEPQFHAGQRCVYNGAPGRITAVTEAGYVKVMLNGGSQLRVRADELVPV